MGLLDIFDRAVARRRLEQPPMSNWAKPVWSIAQARQLLHRYPDDYELWRRAVAHLDQQADAGASGDWMAACFQVLEDEWTQQRGQTSP
jgi:hypothetical protein